MKDSKSLLLIIVSFLLIAVSLVLLWTWGYKIGNQKGVDDGKIYVISDTTRSTMPDKDSLFHLYFEAMHNLSDLDSALDKADSLKSDINNKLGEFYQLRDELLGMLNKPIDRKGIKDADKKMGELQKRMDQLKIQNNNIEKENKRLSALLNRLPAEMRVRPVVADTAAVVAISSDVPVSNAGEMVSGLTFFGAMERDGESLVSDSAATMEKLTGNFTFVSPKDDAATGVIYIVVTTPDGKVMRSTSWDTGAFETKEGRKIYTSSVKYEAMPGETQQLSFAVPYDSFQPGEYQIELYNNGVKIANGVKVLK